MFPHHVGNAVSNNSGLARAGTRKNKQRAVKVCYRLALLIVKPYKELVRILVKGLIRALTIYILEVSEELV